MEKKRKCKIISKFAIFVGVLAALTGFFGALVGAKASTTDTGYQSCGVAGYNISVDDSTYFTNYCYLNVVTCPTPNTIRLSGMCFYSNTNLDSNTQYELIIDYEFNDQVADWNYCYTTHCLVYGVSGRYIYISFDLDPNAWVDTPAFEIDDFMLYLRVNSSSPVQGRFISSDTPYMVGSFASPDVIYQYYYNKGYTQGYQDGVNATSSSAYQKGYTAGVNSVNTQQYYNNGYSAGSTDGYSIGYTAGVDSVDTQQYYNSGYDTGFQAGLSQSASTSYELGVAEGRRQAEQGVTNGKALIWTIASTPFESFKTMLNFDILGVNIAGFIMGLLTVALVIFIIKKFL